MNKYLITAEQLADRVGGNVVVVDCRFSLADVDEGYRQYQQSHISGAYYFDLDKHMSAPKSQHGGRHPLPDIAVFEQRLRAIGVNQNTLVVSYDDQRFAFASRFWWMLRYLGHSNVKVLNGGFKAWQQLALPCDSQQPVAEEGSFSAEPQPHLLVSRQQVIDRDEEVMLIDSREAARYQGLEEPIDPIAGHIDGAVNYPWQQVSDEQGFLNNEAAILAEASNEQLMVYCGSGVTACVNLLSLAEAGNEGAKLYAGSWSDWCSYL